MSKLANRSPVRRLRQGRSSFSDELEKAMQRNNWDDESLAHLLGCHRNTVANWRAERTLPHRDFAILLSRYFPSLRAVLLQIANVEAADQRWSDLRPSSARRVA